MYNRITSHTAGGGGDSGAIGLHAQNLSLQNIGFDQLHSNGLPL